MRDKVVNTLHAPDMLRRVVHFMLAQIIWTLPYTLRQYLFAGTQHYCPVCGSHVRAFLPLHRPHFAWCPVCRSLQRHRLLWLFLSQRTDLLQPTLKRLMHFAPEPALAAQFANQPDIVYVTADRYDSTATERLDITMLPVRVKSFDGILCSHVLEHVPDDHAAIRELHRALDDHGWAIVMVPIIGKTTREDPSITDPVQRERLFGQHDHVRMYGLDIVGRLERGGFKVSPLVTEDVANAEDIYRFGLISGEKLFLCRQ